MFGWLVSMASKVVSPLWGAIDATLRPHADWEATGHSRTRWVAVQGIGAPFLVGFFASIAYFFGIRRQVAHAQLQSTAEVTPVP